MSRTPTPRDDASARTALRILTKIGKAALLIALVVVMYIAYEEYRAQPSAAGGSSGAPAEPV